MDPEDKKIDPNSREIGRFWEQKACDFLHSLGYDILETNWTGSRGEIDIITKKDELIVFVEVKYRKSSIFAAPEMAVNQKKRTILIQCANEYLNQIQFAVESRFDIISISENAEKLNHIEGAFYV
ncbi:MAG: YraN family protein [Flavobacteriales bacterium]|nr:YraN family protein [Flavobacteriales bacterium]